MPVNAVPGKKNAVLPVKYAYAARCMARKIVYFKSYSSQVKSVAFLCYFESNILFQVPFYLHILRISICNSCNVNIVGMNIYLVKISISVYMVNVSVGIDDYNRKSSYRAHHFINIIPPIHG